MCRAHYRRQRLYGDALVVKKPYRADPVCSIPGCDGRTEARGWCTMHYLRWKRHGDVETVLRTAVSAPVCAIPGCGRGGRIKRGWCGRHYKLWQVYGDPLGAPSSPQDALGEEWRPIPGFRGYYEASSVGRIRSLPRVTRDGRHLRGRILRQSGSPYLGVQLSVDGRATRREVHTLIAEAFHGQRPSGLEVRHLNDRKFDNRACNLEWGTRAENMHDRIINGILYQFNRTHCKNKHEWTPANTIIALRADGSFRQRVCRECRRNRKRNRDNRAKKAKVA